MDRLTASPTKDYNPHSLPEFDSLLQQTNFLRTSEDMSGTSVCDNIPPSTNIETVSSQICEKDKIKKPDKRTQSRAKARDRLTYTSEQLQALEDAFVKFIYPSYDDFDALSSAVGIPVKNLRVWFQNARARAKKYGRVKTKNQETAGQLVSENNNTSNEAEDSTTTIPTTEVVWGLRLPVVLPADHRERQISEGQYEDNIYPEQASESFPQKSPTHHTTEELSVYIPSNIYPYQDYDFSDISHLYNDNNEAYRSPPHLKQEVLLGDEETGHAIQPVLRPFIISSTAEEQPLHNSHDSSDMTDQVL